MTKITWNGQGQRLVDGQLGEEYRTTDSSSVLLTAEDRQAMRAAIRSYLGNGGLFNPEMMEHDKVRDLIIDMLRALDSDEARERQQKGCCILDADSPSYPPEECEYRQCSCALCLRHMLAQAERERDEAQAALLQRDMPACPCAHARAPWHMQGICQVGQEMLMRDIARAQEPVKRLKESEK